MKKSSARGLPGARLATLPSRTGTLLLLAISVAWGCGSDSPTGSKKNPPANTSQIVAVHAGNQQTAKVGEAVPVPPAVRVTNSSGAPVAGASVSFVVASGGGTLQGASATTGATGVAAVGAWILGAAGTNSLRATVSGATSGSPATFSAMAEDLVIVSIHAGDQQSAKAGEAVPVPPSVRIVNSTGGPTPGVGVTFAVASGGGSLTGATPTTDADGVAAVGAWILGEVGANTLSVTVEGATSGSPAEFSAMAEEQVIAPTADTTLAGVVNATRLIIPTGVTVTVTDDLVLKTDDLIDIRGSLMGACVPVQLETDGALSVRGTIDNSCPDGDPDSGLTLIARAGYDIEDTSIQSSGDVWLTSDPTLADSDFPAAAGGAPAAVNADGYTRLGVPNAPAAEMQATSVECKVISTTFKNNPAKARNGNDRTGTGLAGADGRRWQIECRGELYVQGGVTFQGQHGGDGGAGTHTPAAGDALAEGGAGGKGGYMIVRATQRVSFDGILNEIVSGAGGRGGDATATSSPSQLGVTGPRADAFGGDGGQPGLFSILAPVIEFNELLDLTIGSAGDGGVAVATSADGLDSEGATTPAQAGGPAYSQGGDGSDTPDLILAARNGVEISGPENARVNGGDAGDGGAAEAFAGTGGKGSSERPDGGTGGTSEARAGNGGDALLKDHRMQLFGAGGNGGDALLSGARGGHGVDRCGLPAGFQIGGNGGSGGELTGQHGEPGTGLAVGAPGIIQLTGAGNGGDAGNGEPAGTAGVGGARTMSSTPQTAGHNTIAGGKGFDCVKPNVVMLESTVHESEKIDSSQPCENAWTKFSLVNFSPDPVDYSIAINNLPGFRATPSTGVVPAAPGAIHPWNTTPIQTITDICTMVLSGPDVSGEIAVTFTLGSTSVTKSVPVKFEFR